MNYSYKTISSLSNPLIKEAIKIKKQIDKRPGFFIIEGSNLIESAFSSPLSVIMRLFFTEDFASKKGSKKFLGQMTDIEKILVTKQIISMITDTDSPQGIAAVISYKPPKLSELRFDGNLLLVLCDALQDPGNLGTIIRASDVFGANAVITLPFTCNPFNPKSIRATAGSIFNIPVIDADQNEIFDFLVVWNINLFSTSSKAKTSIYEINFRQPVAIAFGNESAGVSNILQNKSRDVFKIPIIGRAESLNVAMAASICLYEIARQRNYWM